MDDDLLGMVLVMFHLLTAYPTVFTIFIFSLPTLLFLNFHRLVSYRPVVCQHYLV